MVIEIELFGYKGKSKGKGHPTTGHPGPRCEVEV
jgi:hypothetical protein